jgi:hypothetical protein
MGPVDTKGAGGGCGLSHKEARQVRTHERQQALVRQQASAAPGAHLGGRCCGALPDGPPPRLKVQLNALLLQQRGVCCCRRHMHLRLCCVAQHARCGRRLQAAVAEGNGCAAMQGQQPAHGPAVRNAAAVPAHALCEAQAAHEAGQLRREHLWWVCTPWPRVHMNVQATC